MKFMKRTYSSELFLAMDTPLKRKIIRKYGYITDNYFRDCFLSALGFITLVLFGFMLGFILGIDHGATITILFQTIFVYVNIKIWLFIDKWFKQLSFSIWMDDFDKLSGDEKVQLARKLNLNINHVPITVRRVRKKLYGNQNTKNFTRKRPPLR